MAETKYIMALAREIDRAFANSDTFTHLIRAGRGARPDEVLGIAKDIRGIRNIPKRVIADAAYEFELELHQLLFEWYFNKRTAVFVTELIRPGSEVLCVGSPTVASELARDESAKRVTLFDADSGVVSRFPMLKKLDELLVGDVSNGMSSSRKADVVVIDPPWYLEDFVLWMHFARSFVADGGTIIATIFPDFVRPAAWDERERLFAMAETAGGTVEIQKDKAVYSTPRFEIESLRASGCPNPGDWRVADFLVIRNVKRSFRAPSVVTRPHEITGWWTFTIGTQVVKLSMKATARTNIINPIPDCPENILPSVSSRDPRLAAVGLWTSRNRVASIGNPRLVRGWLDQIRSSGIDDVIQNTDHMYHSQLTFLKELLDVGGR